MNDNVLLPEMFFDLRLHGVGVPSARLPLLHLDDVKPEKPNRLSPCRRFSDLDETEGDE